MDLTQSLQRFMILLVPMLLGMICHEVAHGWVALRQGDPTAAMLGRLTLNPRPHLDPMGSAFFLLTFFTGSPVVLGWAKPVPINPRRFKNYRKGMIAVSAAGALANFTLAILFALLFFIYIKILGALGTQPGSTTVFLLQMLKAGVSINVTLACFNLVPIPPLDGSKILAHLLPPRLAMMYASLSRYGFFILIIVLYFGLLRWLWPIIGTISNFIFGIFGLPPLFY